MPYYSTKHTIRLMGQSRARRTFWVCGYAMLLSTSLAWLLIAPSGTARQPTDVSAKPALLVLTSDATLNVQYEVQFYRSAYTGPTGTRFSSENVFLPTDAVAIRLAFRNGAPQERFKWAVLQNKDAALTKARSIERLGDISVSSPGAQLDSQCDAALASTATQVLSGDLVSDNLGMAEVTIVGGVPDQVRYPELDRRISVNAFRIEAPPTSASEGGGCHFNLINWEQVGGYDWVTPHVTSGTVAVGDVPNGMFVDSANPGLDNARSLTWTSNGPASFSYTLFDAGAQNQRELRFLLAGVVAALAATLLVEVVKAGVDGLIESGSKITDHYQPAASGPSWKQPSNKSAKRSAKPIVALISLCAALGWVYRSRYRANRRM